MDKADELIETFKERAEAVQTIVARVGGLDEAFRYAVEITKKQGGSSVAAPGLDEGGLAKLGALCKESEIALLSKDLRSQVSGIHTGFSIADWGIAETATLVQESSAEDVRIATMLSEIHVAALPASRIRPDASALKEEIARFMQDSSYVAFISGASRTADIERVLTIGVHGPQELHVLIVEDKAS